MDPLEGALRTPYDRGSTTDPLDGPEGPPRTPYEEVSITERGCAMDPLEGPPRTPIRNTTIPDPDPVSLRSTADCDSTLRSESLPLLPFSPSGPAEPGTARVGEPAADPTLPGFDPPDPTPPPPKRRRSRKPAEPADGEPLTPAQQKAKQDHADGTRIAKALAADLRAMGWVVVGGRGDSQQVARLVARFGAETVAEVFARVKTWDAARYPVNQRNMGSVISDRGYEALANGNHPTNGKYPSRLIIIGDTDGTEMDLLQATREAETRARWGRPREEATP